MKKFKIGTLKGWAGRIIQGWVMKLGVLTLGGTLLFSSIGTAATVDGTRAMTQGEYMQWLLQLGGHSQLPLGATAAEYVQTMRDMGISPTSGWDYNGVLTRDVLAQTLVQFFNINTKKQNTDYAALLEREAITLPEGTAITRVAFVNLVDEFGFQSRIGLVAKKKKTVLCPAKTPGKPPRLKSKCSPPKSKPKPPKPPSKPKPPKPPSKKHP
jgi:hypothetical protein